MVVGASEGDDLADGRPVGDHAGVALVREQAKTAVGDALGRLPEQLRGVEPVPTAGHQEDRGGDVVQLRGASNTSSAAIVTGMSEGGSARWPPPNSHISAARARPPAAVAASTSRRTKCGWSMANCWAIEPPVEMPSMHTGPGNWWAIASV